MTKLLKLVCVVCFIFVLEDGFNMLGGEHPGEMIRLNLFSPPSVEAGWIKKVLSKLKNARPPSLRRKADQAKDNQDRASETARNISERRDRERKEHEQRRSREKATRDERRNHGGRRGGRDRSREKANRDRDRMDRGGRDRSREKANRDRGRMDRGK